jgi:hypothetical protein
VPGHAQLKAQITRGLEPLFGLLLQAMPYDLLELWRYLRNRWRVLLKNRIHRLDARIAQKRPPARQHLVQNRPQRENVRPMIGRLPLHLLRRHVGRRSKNHSGSGLGLDLILLLRPWLHQPGQPEVENLHAAVSSDEDVLRLEIPVHDTFIMGGSQALGDLAGIFDRFTFRDGAAGEPLAQCGSFEQLGDKIGRTLFSADRVDRQDIRMVQQAGRSRFLLEPPQALRIVGVL